MSENMWDVNEIIIRYLDHTATQEEKDFLLEWLRKSEQNQDDFTQIRDLWLLSDTPSDDGEEIEAALRKLRQRITGRQRARMRPANRLRPFRVAAGILLLAGTALTFFFWGKSSTTSTTIVQNKLLTADGSKGRFILPDSTVVWLNASSTLQYPEQFTASARDVILEGQAYFEVAKNKEKPFRVHAGEMEVEVLGTHFQVTNYPQKSAMEAVLVEGCVKVAGCGMERPVTLTPGQLLSYDKRSGKTGIHQVDTGNYISWTNGRISFDNTPLTDIILHLEQWFATDIVYHPDFARNISVSFTVRTGDTLDEILEAMSMVAPISYHKENGTVYITAKE